MSHYPGKRQGSKGEGPDLLAGPAAAFSWLPGGRPAVHRGFLNSWRANGLNQRVKQRVWDILYSKDVDRSNVKVLCTGQSFGPAAPDCCAVASSHIFWVIHEQEGHILLGLISASPACTLIPPSLVTCQSSAQHLTFASACVRTWLVTGGRACLPVQTWEASQLVAIGEGVATLLPVLCCC